MAINKEDDPATKNRNSWIAALNFTCHNIIGKACKLLRVDTIARYKVKTKGVTNWCTSSLASTCSAPWPRRVHEATTTGCLYHDHSTPCHQSSCSNSCAVARSSESNPKHLCMIFAVASTSCPCPSIILCLSSKAVNGLL